MPASNELLSKKYKGIKPSRTLIIEFVGLPGAGKSTSCQWFSKLLKSEGKQVYLFQDLKEYINNMNYQNKILLGLRFVFLRGPMFLVFISFLLYNRIFDRKSIYRYIRLSLFDLALKHFIKRVKADVILLDQWMIQELWSITIFKKGYNRISKYLSRFYFKTDTVFYFNIDVKTAAERIKFRSTGISRFDRMDETKRVEELIKYDSYLFELFQSSSCAYKQSISGLECPEKNAQIFVQCLHSFFQLN